MYLFNIVKLEGRRSGKDRRNSDNTEKDTPERRSSTDRRTGRDRRSNSERRSGAHYILTEQQKVQLESMYKFLEERGLG